MRIRPQFGILEFLIGVVCIAFVLVGYLHRTRVEVISLVRVPFASSASIHETNKSRVAESLTSTQAKSKTVSQFTDLQKPMAARLLETLEAEYHGKGELLQVSVTGRDRQKCIAVLDAHIHSNLLTSGVPVIVIQTGIAPNSSVEKTMMIVSACWIGLILLVVIFGRTLVRRFFTGRARASTANST